ncbi:MAG: hypothetical protein MUF79_00370 [Burkholderiales bacterium]|jgi:hypothetical protein|nr:hypothetical protein [Burkholderiales bacterium]
MNVRLVIPDLVWPGEVSGVYDDLPAPALEHLLAKGRRTSAPAETLEGWLLAEFGVALGDELPVAPYTLLADGGDPGADAWMRADPVHVQVAREALLLADAATFAIDRAEAEQLAESLNRHFAADGLVFFPVRPDRWYLRLSALPRLTTTPLPHARGRAVSMELAIGADAVKWHGIANEAQMLLHADPVNAARESRGAPAVNSIWLWGAGRIAPVAPGSDVHVYANEPLARGLAIASRAALGSLPASGATLLAQAPRDGVALVVLDDLRSPAAYGEAGAWRERLAAIEHNWIAPLLAALKEGRVGMLTIASPGEGGSLRVETTRQDLRYFWRRTRSLGEHVAWAAGKPDD